MGRVDRIDVLVFLVIWSYAGTYQLFCMYAGKGQS